MGRVRLLRLVFGAHSWYGPQSSSPLSTLCLTVRIRLTRSMSRNCRPHISPALSPPTRRLSHTASRVYSGMALASTATSVLVNGSTSRFVGLPSRMTYVQGFFSIRPRSQAAFMRRFIMRIVVSRPLGVSMSRSSLPTHLWMSFSVMAVSLRPVK